VEHISEYRFENPEWFERLDFVRMDDSSISMIFAEDAASDCRHLPPQAWRRHAKHIVYFLSLPPEDQHQVRELGRPPPPTTGSSSENKPAASSAGGVDKIRMKQTSQLRSVEGGATCPGITQSYLMMKSLSINEERRAKIEKGLRHVVGGCFSTKGTEVSNGRWLHGGNVHGLVRNKNDKSVAFYLREDDSDGKLMGESDILDRTRLFHTSCKINLESGATVDANGVCNNCRVSGIRALQDLCVRAVDMREKEYSGLDRTRHDVLETSPTLMKKGKIHPLIHDRRNRQKQESYERIRARVLANGVEVDVKAAGEVYDKAKPHLAKFLSNESVSTQDLSTYLFDEAHRKVTQARVSGRSTIRHCPVFIRLSMAVMRAMGQAGGLYDLMAKSFGLASRQTLSKYGSPGAHDPDGIQHDTLCQRQAKFDAKFPGADMMHWSRKGILAFDAMYHRDGLCLDYHTLEVVGYTEEFWSESVVRSQLKNLAAQADSDAGDDAATATTGPGDAGGDTATAVAVADADQSAKASADDEEDESHGFPGLGKQYLVFYFTTWDKDYKSSFLAARYSLRSISGDTMLDKINEVTIGLALYGFIVTSTGEDGASENRSALKALGTISVKEYFKNHAPKSAKEKLGPDIWAVLEAMPDVPMAYRHPIYDEVLIFIGGDMPHCIKKVVNTLERSGWAHHDRNLRRNGQKMSLKMLEKCWVASGESSLDGGVSLRKYVKSWQHFIKCSYSRLRVSLSVQITSQDSVKCIKDNCDKDLGGLELYSPLIELLEKMDRLIDIINCTRMNRGSFKGCEPINEPFHKHVIELLNILKYLYEWKKECGGYTHKFLTQETYEDLQWTILGVIGNAMHYLDEDKSCAMYQARSGSDVCEHAFSLIRSKNVNPTAAACRQASARSSSASDAHLFRFQSGANSGGCKRKATDYLAPVPKKSKMDNGGYWNLSG